MTEICRGCYRNTEDECLKIRTPGKVGDTWAESIRICNKELGGEGETFQVEGTVYTEAWK